MPYVETARGRLYYIDHRVVGATRPPLLVIHGAGATHLDFPIALRKKHSLAPDLPGHGRSDPPGFDRVEAYAESMLAFMDALNVPEAYVMGHSMGGAVAQIIALTAPQRVRGLILLATGAYLPVSPTLLQGLGEKIVETLGLIIKWEWAKDTPESWKDQSLKQLLQTPPQVIARDYWACSQFDVRAQLGVLTCPTLILGGTQDRMTPPALQDDLAARLPHATYHSIAGGGHMVALEQADRVTALVDDWIVAQESTKS